MIADDGDTLVPLTEVIPLEKKKDGSAIFRLFGGPYHNMKVRVYEPYARVVWKLGNETHVYRIFPPVKGSREKWVYMYDPDDKSDITKEEIGYVADPEAIQRWANLLRFKRDQENARLDALGVTFKGEESHGEDDERD